MQDGNLAQFFTPAAVAEFTWELSLATSGCDRFTRVIDPAAGRGVFLDVGLSRAWVEPGGAYGIELDPRLSPPLGMAKDCARFHIGDGLAESFPGVRAGSFDLVIGNPPFGTTARVLPQRLVERLERLGEARFRIGHQDRTRAKPVSKRQIEHLFVERALELARVDGVVALILPEGFVANMRYQAVRDWVLERSDLLAVVGLPESTFRATGLNALTSVVVLRKRPDGGAAGHAVRPPVLMAGRQVGRLKAGKRSRQDTDAEIRRLTEAMRSRLAKSPNGRTATGRTITGRSTCFFVPTRDVAGKRWDVSYWRGVLSNAFSSLSRFSEAALGDFIQHLTYGPIVTGVRPQHVNGGIPVIRQVDFGETGLCLSQVLRVTPGGAHDPVRSRVRTGDLLLPRSGVGSLGRNRMAVYMMAPQANVGCFVDLIRLSGLNPYYVWLLLRSEPGWGQIRSLINGVGTPNINFSEIRSLRIPLIPLREQNLIEARYREAVWPHHKMTRGAASSAPAHTNFQRIRTDLESYLAGSLKSLKV